MKPRALLVMVDSNRVTCGDCHHLSTFVGLDEWACGLFGAAAHLGLKSHMKTPNRAPVCTEAEADATALFTLTG